MKEKNKKEKKGYEPEFYIAQKQFAPPACPKVREFEERVKKKKKSLCLHARHYVLL